MGGVATNNPYLHKVGTDVLNRLNLGGGARPAGQNNELATSQNNLNLGSKDAGAIGGTFRSNLGGVDKSMENLKLGFG